MNKNTSIQPRLYGWIDKPNPKKRKLNFYGSQGIQLESFNPSPPPLFIPQSSRFADLFVPTKIDWLDEGLND